MKGKDRKRMDKFLNGTLSQKEARELKEWMQEPGNAAFLKGETQLHYRLNALLNRFDTDKAYERNIILRTHEAPKRKFPFQTVLRYAALLLAAIGMAGLLLTLLPAREETLIIPDTQITLETEDGSLMNIQPGENREILTRNGEAVSTQRQDVLYYDDKTKNNRLVYNTLKVPYGKTFKVQLSDGSLVHLNAGTQLKYPRQFTGSERRVYLTGEAYFEVAHNANKPFIVATAETDTRVLGTTFNVTAYNEEGLTTIVLVEGSVLIYEKDKAIDPDNSVVLVPGELARWDEDAERMSVSRVDVSEYTSWREGKLVFEDRTFEQMLRVLERRYNVKIENRYTELNNGRYRARFEDESIEQVLKTFVKSRLFGYTIKDNTIIIDKPENEQ